MQGSFLPSRSREKMRCADFRVFSLRGSLNTALPSPRPGVTRAPGIKKKMRDFVPVGKFVREETGVSVGNLAAGRMHLS